MPICCRLFLFRRAFHRERTQTSEFCLKNNYVTIIKTFILQTIRFLADHVNCMSVGEPEFAAAEVIPEAGVPADEAGPAAHEAGPATDEPGPAAHEAAEVQAQASNRINELEAQVQLLTNEAEYLRNALAESQMLHKHAAEGLKFTFAVLEKVCDELEDDAA